MFCSSVTRVIFIFLLLHLQLSQECQSEAPSLPGPCPEDPSPRYFPDLSECSRYWLCVGGCATNFQVKQIHFLHNLTKDSLKRHHINIWPGLKTLLSILIKVI